MIAASVQNSVTKIYGLKYWGASLIEEKAKKLKRLKPQIAYKDPNRFLFELQNNLSGTKSVGLPCDGAETVAVTLLLHSWRHFSIENLAVFIYLYIISENYEARKHSAILKN